MSSLLSFQIRQQEKAELKVENDNTGLPSPPNSFCGDETNNNTNKTSSSRRDSLQTSFRDMTIKEYPASLPENYTIDHSVAKRNASTSIATATAAATGGLTIRNRRQSEININYRRKSVNRTLSESFSGQYRCVDCGKSYKSPNCLQKHRWEHSEEWEITKKLLLTKHQQVQMLEAASILIGMDRRNSQHSININNNIEEEKTSNRSDSEESIVIDDEVDEVDNEIDHDDDDEADDDDDDVLSIVSSNSSGIFMEDL